MLTLHVEDLAHAHLADLRRSAPPPGPRTVAGRHPVRRPVGLWLARVGLRLAGAPAPVHPAPATAGC